jgi:hypothetical protein
LENGDGSSRPNEKLSVVVAASTGARFLESCLASLRRDVDAGEADVVVVSNYPVSELDDRYRFAKFLALPQTATVPALRAAGIAQAGNRVIALIEDNCRVDESWCREVKLAHAERPDVTIGGAVERPARATLADWAVYLFDYGAFMPPVASGEVQHLPGNNVTYTNETLRAIRDRRPDLLRDGFFEAFVNAELRSSGNRLYLHSPAVVSMQSGSSFGKAVRHSYHGGRVYGARRPVKGMRRLIYGCGSVLLPLILPVRVLARALARRRDRMRIIASSLHLVILTTSWSLGEMLGYFFGEGESARHWR